MKSADFTGLLEGPAEALDYSPTAEDERLAADVMRKFELFKSARADAERDWQISRYYLEGETQLYQDVMTGEVVRLQAGSRRRLWSNNNKLRSLARALLGKMTENVPGFEVMPATGETEEVFAARAAEAFLGYIRERQELEIKFTDWIQQTIETGNSVLQLCWNPHAGARKAICHTCDEMAEETMIGGTCPECGAPDMDFFWTGDIEVKHRNVWDVYVEPGRSRPQDVNEVVVVTQETIQGIRHMFPKMGVFVSGGMTQRDRGLYSETTEEDLQNSVLLYEYHAGPSAEYPDGRVVWMADNIILEESTGYYGRFGRLPFFWSFWERYTGDWWAQSPISQAKSRQKELNHLETNIREHVELLATTKITLPQGSKIEGDEITATTGQIIRFHPAAGPADYMRPPNMPSDVFTRTQTLPEDMRQLFGVTAQEQGSLGSDPNGRAFAIVEAQARQQIGPILRRTFSEWKNLHYCILQLVKKYGEDEAFGIAGDYGMELYSFRDLSLSPGFDLALVADDGLSQNKAVRMQQAIELVNAGVLGQPGTPQFSAMFARIAKLKLPHVGYDNTSSQYSAAQMLIEKVEATPELEYALSRMSMVDNPTIFANAIQHWLQTKGRDERQDPELVQIMAHLWQKYSAWAQENMAPQGVGLAPPPTQGTTPSSGPAPTSRQAPGDQGSVIAQASETVQGADAAAEGLARQQANQES